MAATAVQKPLRPLWAEMEYKQHQIVGIRWMLEREQASDGPRGGILADEMGLGKTIQMAALIKNGQRKIGEQILLIAPVAVLEQWRQVLLRSKFGVASPAGKGYGWRTETGRERALAPQVHLIGYEALTRNSGLGRLYRWDRVICDEAHRLSPSSTVSDVVKTIRSGATWLLTATPVVNAQRDLVNLLEILGVKDLPRGELAGHKAILNRYVLSRTMDQLRAVLPDAPPVPRYETRTLPFRTEEEAEFYRGMSGIIQRRWKALEADGGGGAALERLKLFMRLRQLSLHPQVYIQARKMALKKLYTRPDWVGSSTKFDAIRELICGDAETTAEDPDLPDRAPEPHKWIVFCHFRHEIEMLTDMLRAQPAIGRVLSYHGGLTAAQKQTVIETTHTPLEKGSQEVLLVQLQSGGTGLNLQHFDRILFSGPWWTKALMEQAVGRAVRIGQKKVVVIYHLLLKEEEALNIDDYMTARAAAKGNLCRRVLSYATTAVTEEEMRLQKAARAAAAPAVVAAPLDADGFQQMPAAEQEDPN